MSDDISQQDGAKQTDRIPGLDEEESKKAAELIQRVYRGHRSRRATKGLGLDASTRWIDAVKEARFAKVAEPKAPDQADSSAASRWRHATEIAQRAGADDVPSDTSDEAASETDNGSVQQERRREAKTMGIRYFLEMIDHKHRYGSSLRKYHKEWMKDEKTNQNFFYWLDHGDGQDVEIGECSRERLEREQIRYLSKQERAYYLVRVNGDGLLEWAKNGELVWTKDELFRDSEQGIVSNESEIPSWQPKLDPRYVKDAEGTDRRKPWPNPPSKSRKWIFVADTSFRLYIGYKQSGSFQHSSFMHGSRILSAGQIKVKKGQLRQISPLSGHYRPPVSSFRAFVHSLESSGADMSRVSITQSYAVLLGLNSYKSGTTKLTEGIKQAGHQVDKVFRPAKAKRDADAAADHSQSAQREEEFLRHQKETK